MLLPPPAVTQYIRGYLQIDSLVPVDNVAGHNERLNVDDVNVTTVRAYVQPLALEGQVTEGDSEIATTHSELNTW